MWISVDSGSWWWIGRPGMLWFMGSQRVEHDWVTELNWFPAQIVVMSFICVPPAAHWLWAYLDTQKTSNKTCQLLDTLIVPENSSSSIHAQNSSSSIHARCRGSSGDLPFTQSRNLDFILNILPQTSLSSVHSVSDIFKNLFWIFTVTWFF